MIKYFANKEHHALSTTICSSGKNVLTKKHVYLGKINNKKRSKVNASVPDFYTSNYSAYS